MFKAFFTVTAETDVEVIFPETPTVKDIQETKRRLAAGDFDLNASVTATRGACKYRGGHRKDTENRKQPQPEPKSTRIYDKMSPIKKARVLARVAHQLQEMYKGEPPHEMHSN